MDFFVNFYLIIMLNSSNFSICDLPFSSLLHSMSLFGESHAIEASSTVVHVKRNYFKEVKLVILKTPTCEQNFSCTLAEREVNTPEHVHSREKKDYNLTWHQIIEIYRFCFVCCFFLLSRPNLCCAKIFFIFTEKQLITDAFSWGHVVRVISLVSSLSCNIVVWT